MAAIMTLGELTATLRRKKQDDPVRFDFVYFKPNGIIGSYRGYYEQLALGYSDSGPDITVKELIKLLEEANGATFTGWKGGKYTMHDRTPIWVANPGESGGTAIVDVESDYYVRLKTEVID